MSGRRQKSQYIPYEDSLEYEEDYIEEESLLVDGEETAVEYPVTRASTHVRNSSRPDDYKSTPSYHVKQAEKALKTLKEIIMKSGWEKILTHKSGVDVYFKPGTNQHDRIPIFMGEHIISGISPQSVFAVIGMRKLWDEWYEEGSLVENLNDTISSTYMVMRAFSGSKTRDLSLVEKVECTPSGTIFFVATSIDNPKVPRMDGRIRADLKINGWILEPILSSPPKTKITYILQVDINGWVPSLIAKKYLMRRPLVLHNIEIYLKKNGPPPMIISTTPPPSRRISKRTTSEVSNDNESTDTKHSKKKKVPRMSGLKEIEPTSLIMDEGTERIPFRNRKSSSNPSLTSKEAPVSSPFSTLRQSAIGSDNKYSAPRHTLPPLHLHRLFDSSTKQNSLRKITHRHTESANRAVAKIKFLTSNYDGWNLYTDNQGVKIFMRDVPDKSTPQVRGETIISDGFTPEDILSVIVSMDMRKLWDDRFDEGKVVERLGQGDDILARVCMKGTFPISGRDLATISKIEKDPETGTIWLASISVSDPLVPETKKHVRAELNVAGWRLQPVIDEFGKANSVEVIYIVDIDIKLESIPSSILKSISTQTPMCVAKVDEQIRKTGHPPYIKTTSGIVISEALDTKTYQYDLTIGSVNGDNVTEIKVSNVMYPSGFNIDVIPESSRVELSDTNVVRITLPTEIEIETLNVKITKYYSEDAQYTFNGEGVITHLQEVEKLEVESIVSIEDSVEHEEIVEPFLSSKKSTYDNNETPPTNEKRNSYANEKVLKEQDQSKNGKLSYDQSGITSPDTLKPIEEVQNAMTQHEISKSKSSKVEQDIENIDYSIPRPDQYAKKYVPAPLFEVNATKYIPEPIFTQSSETYTSDFVTVPSSTTEQTNNSTSAHDSHSTRPTPQQKASYRNSLQKKGASRGISSQQRSSRRISSRMLPEHLINQNQFYEVDNELKKDEHNSMSNRRVSFITIGDVSNKRISILLGKKEIGFSPQEAGLMFALMTLAYYVGKLSACGVY
ncbi:7758_t:CDS:2 [Acaulospora morrowiae]|uniref:7758_t:CDS:1 n=1 Tax=Acaulospora morrowiae TaxID=94023 RepID=A0A9N9BZM6_9GLOM|nr:7758_t:CDS:2 [Acaulospora morrowiae]